MALYCDHGVVVIDEEDRRLVEKRVPNSLDRTLTLLAPFQPDLAGIAVESTFNWYWLLETGDIRRFPSVGDYASYCRLVQTEKLSNGKRKGEGNRKGGNKYLSWAFAEAAHFCLRYEPAAKRFFERKRAKTNGIVAIRALAHKLARAAYYRLREQKPFEASRLFAH